MKRVVVTGCGVVSPVGVGKGDFWNSLLAGKSGIGKVTQIDTTDFDSHIAGEVSDFVPPEFIPPKDLRRCARFVQFSLKATEEAFKESGIDMAKEDPYRVGAIIGSGIGSLQAIEKEYKD